MQIRSFTITLLAIFAAVPTLADENLLGYVKGAETLPENSWEGYTTITNRSDKSQGHYNAWDAQLELEYGVTHRFTVSSALLGRSVDTRGLLVDGYLPKDEDTGFKFSGVEVSGKYNFLSPALDDFGLSGYWSLEYNTIDAHSGQDKDTLSFSSILIGQKYFLEGQLIWAGNAGVEATYAKRDDIDGLPDNFEWSTDAETEIELGVGTGLSYRFAPNWFVGAEILYETEYETEVGQERYSIFGGPSLHYGGPKWWVTLTWLPQLTGGGENFEGQDPDYHLIEKTEQEYRLKVGYNF
jgi:opacity protein-like surface antigen